MSTHQVYLSRRNLLTLVSKLDRKLRGEATECTIIKNDMVHPVYPQTCEHMIVTAVEDREYYAHRSAGDVHALDDPSIHDKETAYASAMAELELQVHQLEQRWETQNHMLKGYIDERALLVAKLREAGVQYP